MTRPILRASPCADFADALAGWEPEAFGVGYDGAVYAVARRPSGTEPAECLVVRAQGGETRSVRVGAVPMKVSFVQPVPGRVLLAAARSAWHPARRNALVVDWNGTIQRNFTIGDGVQDVRTTPRGEIWASYFDEGVYGNTGWVHPLFGAGGSPGLVGFDAQGDVRFAYDAAAARTDPIDDAYAMNVDDEGAVWLYFYSQFPIVRIVRGEYRNWTTLGFSGARALAVRGEAVLLFGDSHEHDFGRVVALEGDGARVVEEVMVEGDRGESLDRAVVYGRGGSLFFFTDRRALVLSDW